jgi:WD repeat-containing protein 19
VALKVNERHIWLALASKALEVLDIDVAIRAYRFLNDAGMVLSLENLSFVEDKNLLAGFILMIFMDYDSAQNSLQKSNRIDIAIDMRLNVLHFDEALSLASKSCQEKLIFDVSLKYGQYLESIGKSERALAMYDTAYNLRSSSKIKASCDTESCTGGLARSLIRSGNFERGFKVALQIENIPIKAACAELLLSCNQIVEAAALYESCHDFDKAAELYLRVNHVTFLGKILDKIISSELLAKIGMALEDAGRNRLAMEAYGRAGEVNSFVRINLKTGGHPKAAIEMVKNHKSIESAKILIDYCLQQASVDYTSVVELLIMSAEHERAFSIAKENNLMETFVERSVIDSNIAIIVGKYYEENGILGKAGQFYSASGQYDRAIRLYLESGEDCITDAIRLTQVTKDISHVSAVIDYLTSERHSKAKDPLLILKVFSSLENFGEAVVYALSVAKRNQENGEYSKAHIVIASLICTMERKNTHVPQKLRSKFTLYHSYKLIKFHAKRGSHKNSASLLLRVIENLDDFPHHKYDLLVSTVIECIEAGFLVSLIA